MGLFGWVSALRESFADERRRSVSVVGQRAYVEFRHIPPESLAHFATLLEEEALVFPNLAELGLEPLTRRVMLRFVGAVPNTAALSGAVARAEQRVDAPKGPHPHAPEELRRVLPDDEQLDFEYTRSRRSSRAPRCSWAWACAWCRFFRAASPPTSTASSSSPSTSSS